MPPKRYLTVQDPAYSAALSRFHSLVEQFCSEDDRGPQLQRLFKYLAECTNFFEAPASIRHHLHRPGGLLIHSVNVAELGLKLRDVLMPDYPKAPVILVCLTHDAGKIGTPLTADSIPRYQNVRAFRLEDGSLRRCGCPGFRYNRANLALPLAVNSLYIVSKWLDLFPAECQAILAHDGQRCADNTSVAHQEQPLTLLVEFADTFAGRVLEEELPLDAFHNRRFGTDDS